jgi:hypothetical protein
MIGVDDSGVETRVASKPDPVNSRTGIGVVVVSTAIVAPNS